MEKVNKQVRFIELFNVYKDLLSATQQSVLEAYYCFDLSLSEIASERNISRAAVEDALKKGSQKLEEYEAALHNLERKEEILKLTAKIKEKHANIEEIEEIERRLK